MGLGFQPVISGASGTPPTAIHTALFHKLVERIRRVASSEAPSPRVEQDVQMGHAGRQIRQA